VVLAPSAPADADRVRQELQAFEQVLTASEELSIALESPSISRPRKRAVVERLAESLGLSRVTRNFLYVLIDHRRIRELRDIIAAFEKVVNERSGILQAEAASASNLSDYQRKALVGRLEFVTGKQVRLNLTIDPDLVGGVVVRLGSTVYDGSVRGQLDALGRQLRADI
jgi:F-type H+-transporting ATPase subunit delta